MSILTSLNQGDCPIVLNNTVIEVASGASGYGLLAVKLGPSMDSVTVWVPYYYGTSSFTGADGTSGTSGSSGSGTSGTSGSSGAAGADGTSGTSGSSGSSGTSA